MSKTATCHLERAARFGSYHAMMLLGVAHQYGYATGEEDLVLSSHWYHTSGQHEGLLIFSSLMNAMGRKAEARNLRERAQRRGVGSPYRMKVMYQHMRPVATETGHLYDFPWPKSRNGRTPGQFGR